MNFLSCKPEKTKTDAFCFFFIILRRNFTESLMRIILREITLRVQN